MKLPDEQLILDTNILLHLLRARNAGRAIETTYAVGQRTPRALISVVTKGELKALGYKFGWNAAQRDRLNAMLSGLLSADISHDSIQEAYARLDHASATFGVKMGKNDLWIAATAQVTGGVLLTTDRDFDHLHPSSVRVEYVDIERLTSE